MKATRIFYDKAVLPDGAIVEMTIWQLPNTSPERTHGLKYSLFYGRDGRRIVGYDNERGKGDHKHVHGIEFRYKFLSVEQLVADFLADVERMKNEHHE
ncbi:toxin-antitoxin system TumE family protein [Rhodoferax lacus]|nr:DUF6516 family protein [Rhodoferax lacus]